MPRSPASATRPALCVGLLTPHSLRPKVSNGAGDLRSKAPARSGDLRRARCWPLMPRSPASATRPTSRPPWPCSAANNSVSQARTSPHGPQGRERTWCRDNERRNHENAKERKPESADGRRRASIHHSRRFSAFVIARFANGWSTSDDGCSPGSTTHAWSLSARQEVKVHDNALVALARVTDDHPEVAVVAGVRKRDDERVAGVHLQIPAKKRSNASESFMSCTIAASSARRPTAAINNSSGIGREVFSLGSG